MQTHKLSLQDRLPLTCSRTGNCCFGKIIYINPWELLHLAKEKKKTAREFRDLYSDFGGIRLKFDGKVGWKGRHACSQYVDNFGCDVHLGRPLACRLYPLGRQLQSGEVNYMYQGDLFPCVEECSEVQKLAYLSVGEYLEGQMTDAFEKAQDAYLELMQNIADIAFELLLETGLSESGDKKTLAEWRKMGCELPEVLADRIGQEWMDCLMIPNISDEDSIAFVTKHNELINLKAQEKFGALQTHQELHEASVLIMGVALHLARGLGANPKELSELWIDIAKQNGAQE
ncbi:YkgJ family cysteine cluster protein [Ancylomarina sp. 16SWW S1-10-2]|uniref:YkgJ family cysteine cluster protein n=1 Tax=Ancylomarina sp. 16SWW S1-10-2 TaxID=2499681 RepID=UPI0012ADDCFE|nr:YkgJ family cysteine cluster protein [Ancylomarina sp. 16SWW S1-10-2]MRT93016.1 YkgJ family cysteine cluster protein [Ancylomarina sp. 16SWW S1-10-2]